VPRANTISRTFAALSDPTRLTILARLAKHGDMTVQDIAQPFAMSLPAISQHLKVLEQAGLITRMRSGQMRPCRLRPERLAAAQAWLGNTRHAWELRLDRLDTFLVAKKGPRHDR
jgi:DNA-binding transcriptional ArsR family regulator